MLGDIWNNSSSVLYCIGTHMFIPQKMGQLCRHDFVIDCTMLGISETVADPNNFFYLVLLKS